jgi:hypothetical protein
MAVGCTAADPADNRTVADPAEDRGAADPAGIKAVAAPSPSAAAAPTRAITRFPPLRRGAAAAWRGDAPARADAAGADLVAWRLSGFATRGSSSMSQGATLTGIRRPERGSPGIIT